MVLLDCNINESAMSAVESEDALVFRPDFTPAHNIIVRPKKERILVEFANIPSVDILAEMALISKNNPTILIRPYLILPHFLLEIDDKIIYLAYEVLLTGFYNSYDVAKYLAHKFAEDHNMLVKLIKES